MASSKIPSYQPKGNYPTINENSQTNDISIGADNSWTKKLMIRSANDACSLTIGNCTVTFSYGQRRIIVTTPNGTRSVDLD